MAQVRLPNFFAHPVGTVKVEDLGHEVLVHVPKGVDVTFNRTNPIGSVWRTEQDQPHQFRMVLDWNADPETGLGLLIGPFVPPPAKPGLTYNQKVGMTRP